MKHLALMIIDSGSALRETPMLKGVKKDDTPKEFAYIGFHKAIFCYRNIIFIDKRTYLCYY